MENLREHPSHHLRFRLVDMMRIEYVPTSTLQPTTLVGTGGGGGRGGGFW